MMIFLIQYEGSQRYQIPVNETLDKTSAKKTVTEGKSWDQLE